jgi:plastocyanin
MGGKSTYLALAALLISAAILFGCASPGQNAPPAQAPSPGTPPAQSPAPATQPVATPATPPAPSAGAAQPASTEVTISGFAFNPQTVTVKAGTLVKWTNQDAVAHSVKSSLFSTPDLQTGDSYEYNFTQPGTYDYSCGIHPSMTGKVIVE